MDQNEVIKKSAPKRRGRPPLTGTEAEKTEKARTRKRKQRAREWLAKKPNHPAAQKELEAAELDHCFCNRWGGRFPDVPSLGGEKPLTVAARKKAAAVRKRDEKARRRKKKMKAAAAARAAREKRRAEREEEKKKKEKRPPGRPRKERREEEKEEEKEKEKKANQEHKGLKVNAVQPVRKGLEASLVCRVFKAQAVRMVLMDVMGGVCPPQV